MNCVLWAYEIVSLLFLKSQGHSSQACWLPLNSVLIFSSSSYLAPRMENTPLFWMPVSSDIGGQWHGQDESAAWARHGGPCAGWGPTTKGSLAPRYGSLLPLSS